MRILPNPLDDGFNRLQALLLDMRAGDTLRIGDAVRQSGLSEDVCRSALEALTQIGSGWHCAARPIDDLRVVPCRATDKF